jgi:hypothetical protein
MKEVARFYNSPGISDEETICYLAEGLRVVPREAHGVEEEHLVVERISLADVEELMATGDLVDAKSIIGLLAARRAVGWVTRSPGIAPTPIGGAHAAGHVRAATAAPPEAPPVSTDLEAGGGGQ